MNSLHANDVTAIIVAISVVAVIALFFYGISKSNKKLTKEYNIKHKTNFKTYSDLMNYIRSLSEKDKEAFKIMGLKYDSNWILVQKAFKTLVKKFHPDRNAGNKLFENKLKQITLAYTHLKKKLINKM